MICCLNDEVFKHLRRLSTEADRSRGVDSRGILDADSPEEESTMALEVGDAVRVYDRQVLNPEEGLMAVGTVIAIENDYVGTVVYVGDKEYASGYYTNDYSIEKEPA